LVNLNQNALVKKPKKIANFNCIDRQSRISLENELIFDERFGDEQTCIINAVDNIEERKYITFYEKHLIDSGTLGAKDYIPIIPHITYCYNDSNR
jgi:hypothetical protein